MSAEDRQSQLAREHKERQAKRAEQTTTSKRNVVIGAVAAVVVVAGGLFAGVTLLGDDDDAKAKAAASSSPSPSETPAATPEPSVTTAPTNTKCAYRKDTSGSPMKNVGTPPTRPNLKLKTMTIATNHGNIVIDLATGQAPCTVNSFAFLAKKHFFDNTKCHRLATPENSGLSLLQCGDPQAKADGKNPTDGQGSSGYVYDSENLGGIPYTRGTVAVAQAVDAVNQNGSQFWISLGDETQQVEKAYTPFGVVSQGLEILDEISKGGWITNPDDITGDGGSNAPKIPVVIKNVRLS
ncbi:MULTISPECIES: peptidylprolyl isomerase [unclassified Streptosporangium]|uniref:peptidylprolyl isomerase n=1 Tax=unclassified Streptosporangium TaxID=2632669 RepID=UPI002E2B2202|nr:MULTISPECIES: peptidylprolyl isomerase [unclassified Streptosporangium]